jgi:hypothetical protein
LKALRKYMIGAAMCGTLVLGVGSAALAGESTGSGSGGPAGDGKTGAYTRSNSECAFSGLEDGSEDPTAPSGPGAPPQNWGQIPKAVRDEIKPFASPGLACNGNLAGRK